MTWRVSFIRPYKLVVHERFAICIPAGAPLDRCAPLLCAGATMYDPLILNGCADGTKKVGIAGIGGQGLAEYA